MVGAVTLELPSTVQDRCLKALKQKLKEKGKLKRLNVQEYQFLFICKIKYICFCKAKKVNLNSDWEVDYISTPFRFIFSNHKNAFFLFILFRQKCYHIATFTSISLCSSLFFWYLRVI